MSVTLRYRLAAIPLVAGAIFAIWSLIARPAQSTIDRAQAAAGVRRGTFDAASALGMSLSEERRFVDAFGVGNVEFSIGMWFVLFLTICAALRYLIRTPRRWYWASAVYCAVVACAVSQLGIDFRRWWLLALTAQLATAALLLPAEARRRGGLASRSMGAPRMGRGGTRGMRRLPVESGRFPPGHARSQRLLEKHRRVLGARPPRRGVLLASVLVAVLMQEPVSLTAP